MMHPHLHDAPTSLQGSVMEGVIMSTDYTGRHNPSQASSGSTPELTGENNTPKPLDQQAPHGDTQAQTPIDIHDLPCDEDPYQRIVTELDKRFNRPVDLRTALQLLLDGDTGTWFDTPGLAILAEFRHDAIMWGWITTYAYKRKVLDSRLTPAVDRYIAKSRPDLKPLTQAIDTVDHLPLSDYTNAVAVIKEHGENLHYCYPWKSWVVWTGTHWERDSSGAVIRLAKQTIKGLARQAETLEDDGAVKAHLAHVRKSLSTAALKAMVESAQSEPGISVQPEDLDADPWVLNVHNGTLALRTRTLREHRQADLLTQCLPVPYDPQAPCPTWERFLWRIMGGSQEKDSPDMSAGELEQRHASDERAKRLICFLQRAIGYALTGDTQEQCLFLLHGSGSNGKSTFLEVLQALLGDYAQSTPSASLLAKDRHDQIPNDIARLRGARLVTAVEIGEGKRLNEELVKRLTGQDTLTARFLHGEFFDFQATFKLFVACNHLPQIRGQELAIWRRIKLIPFTVTIPEHEQDKELPAKLRAELPGILRWAVHGCLDWQREGLGTPQEVRAATDDYRTSMDVLGEFLTECCVIADYARIKAGDLYAAYKKWCEDNGEQPLVQRNFGLQLTERGFEHRKSNSTNWRIGIGLSQQDPVP